MDDDMSLWQSYVWNAPFCFTMTDRLAMTVCRIHALVCRDETKDETFKQWSWMAECSWESGREVLKGKYIIISARVVWLEELEVFVKENIKVFLLRCYDEKIGEVLKRQYENI